MHVVSQGHRFDRLLGQADDSPERWRVLVAEDCDELITADAKRRSGHALARLLNLTDGVLGIAERVAAVLTTNEPVPQFHPAILRPGRSVADIAFTPFPPVEARAWLGRSTVPAGELTLAELYREDGDITTLIRGSGTTTSHGPYL